MAGSDALLIGEEWISEHFFTTDATSQSFQARVVARRKAWDGAQAAARPAEDGAERVSATTRARFTQARRWLQDQLAGLGEPAEDTGLVPVPDGVLSDVYARLLEVLGYSGVGLHTERTGPVLRISAPGMTDGAPLVIVEGRATGSLETVLHKDADTLLSPFTLDDDKTELRSVARTLSTLFVSDDAPTFALVLAGRFALVAERAKWAEGRYLAVDLQLVCERNEDRRGGEVDRALACISAESLAPDAEGDIWWSAVLEESVKHTVGVSKDLREGVRLSIEIIANEVVSRRVRQGLPPLPADQAQPLAIQSLRFLYRILFLLYAEASPELGVLPVGSPEYERGYSLDRLRELTLVELASPSAQHGSHLYDSLSVLFRLVDRDTKTIATDGEPPEGLNFRSLRADLFRPVATAHIDDVGLGNAALQQVLRHLLLSKESRGKDRGFISYAELGINQLGAVYEGLMSYTGFFAETDLYEVAKGGDASKGSWVVPVDRADDISPSDFVRDEDPVTGEERPVLHRQGTFVFRLAGRERQQSASYYTPEVLTRFVVSQALEELLDQDGEKTPAEQILQLTVCEPALGSGAFAIEAVRQLAEQYLRRRQDELGQRIEPDEYPRLLQQVKAFIALHNVYGVDFNATAVELAEISLWLDTMVEGLDAPWFGLHLRRGNSLIGARRATFRRDQVTKKTWLTDVPVDAPLTSLAQDVEEETLAAGVGGRVHHFLLPSPGWGATVDAKEAKALVPDALVRLKAWRKSLQAKPTTKQADALVDLGYRVEALWQIAYRRLQIAEQEIRRAIPVWGIEALPEGGAVQRKEIEETLADATGAYRRLRRVMDAWCALWFWPLTDTLTTREVDGVRQRVDPPTLDDWIDALQMLLGRHAGKGRTAAGQQTIAAGTTWAELGDFEANDLGFSSAYSVPAVLAKHPWLEVCEQVATQQGFFHWELEYGPVFGGGGFDLQLGNPPWVRPDWDEKAILAEFDVRWALNAKLAQATEVSLRATTLQESAALAFYLETLTQAVSTRAFLSNASEYPPLTGLRPDLYRCFMVRVWRHNAPRGVAALIHPETHFTDEKAGPLRAAAYGRLRRHWQFINELRLFEIHNLVTYGVHIYGSARPATSFLMATSLYHPDTVSRSLVHDASGSEPGLKDASGNWDLRPHLNRITLVTDETIATWHAILEGDGVPLSQARMVYAVNRSVAAVLKKSVSNPRVGQLPVRYSLGWDEGADYDKGLFERRWGSPATWDDVILQGPHLHVQAPMYKSPNPTMASNKDWSLTDLETVPADAIPATAYKPSGDRYEYDCAYTDWGNDGLPNPARDHYRVAWRAMAANTGERTLTPTIIPPGAAHVDGVNSLAYLGEDVGVLADIAGYLGSLMADFSVRSTPKSAVRKKTIDRLPIALGGPLSSYLRLRVLRLNCLTEAYARLWADAFDPDYKADLWTNPSRRRNRPAIADVGTLWTEATPLRFAADRRQAQVEIDAIVALTLGITADELCSIYRTQFPVLFGYDNNRDIYDINGRLVLASVVAAWSRKGAGLTREERTATNQAGNAYTYELPFEALDREVDMRQAYAHFEQLLKDRS